MTKKVLLRTFGLALILTLLVPPALGLASRAHDAAAAQAAPSAPKRAPAGGGEAAEPDWVQRTPATVPPERVAGAMAYDGERGVTVLFGGRNASNAKLGDTWEWDGVDWVQRAPASHPSARDGHTMAYDGTRRVTLLFGGAIDYGGPHVNDTWEWDGTNWAQRATAHAPSARAYHATAYDAARGMTVLFGGYDGSFRDDTWDYVAPWWTVHLPLVMRGPTNEPPNLRPGHAAPRHALPLAGRGLGRALCFHARPGVALYHDRRPSPRHGLRPRRRVPDGL